MTRPGAEAAAATCASNACCVAFVTSSLALVYSRVACYASGECKTPPFPDLDFDWPDMCKPIGDRPRDVVSRTVERVRPYRTPAPEPKVDDEEEERWPDPSVPPGDEVYRDPDYLGAFWRLCTYVCPSGRRFQGPCK